MKIAMLCTRCVVTAETAEGLAVIGLVIDRELGETLPTPPLPTELLPIPVGTAGRGPRA